MTFFGLAVDYGGFTLLGGFDFLKRLTLNGRSTIKVMDPSQLVSRSIAILDSLFCLSHANDLKVEGLYIIICNGQITLWSVLDWQLL